MYQYKRHMWSESDEISLLSVVQWYNDNVFNKSAYIRTTKWTTISNMLFQNSGIKISGNACRKRYANITKRSSMRNDHGKQIINLLGVDFPQAYRIEDDIKDRILALETKVENIISSVNSLSVLSDKLTTIINKTSNTNSHRPKFITTNLFK